MEDPPVFLDYDQAALDSAYDQAAYASNREQLIKRRIRDSELTHYRIGEPERVAYGSAEIERLDIYRARRNGRQFSSSSMAAPGAAGARRSSQLRPKCSLPPGRIMSFPTSPGYRMSQAT